MNDYKTELKKFLTSSHDSISTEKLISSAKLLSEKDLASLFTTLLYLQNVVQLIVDEYWIQNQNSQIEIQHPRLIKRFLSSELKPFIFLHPFFQETDLSHLKNLLNPLLQLKESLVSLILTLNPISKKVFLQNSLSMMSDLIELEHQIGNLRKSDDPSARISLDRAFDVLDRIFQLEYLSNEKATLDQKERLYEGGGAGVQSSYATTLTALRYLNLPKGSHFIDLGSGYGRVGLVLGLLRPDLLFTGFEYVTERVEMANRASQALALGEKVKFVAQNLALPDFKIPLADTFYIFDSFSDESYVFILDQLQKMTQLRKITVVTKGNARLKMNTQFWSEPQEFHGGHLCFFRSKLRSRGV